MVKRSGAVISVFACLLGSHHFGCVCYAPPTWAGKVCAIITRMACKDWPKCVWALGELRRPAGIINIFAVMFMPVHADGCGSVRSSTFAAHIFALHPMLGWGHVRAGVCVFAW